MTREYNNLLKKATNSRLSLAEQKRLKVLSDERIEFKRKGFAWNVPLLKQMRKS